MDNERLGMMVRQYQATDGPRLENYLSAFRELVWPPGVIYDAVHGRNGEIHNHQWRLRFRPEKLAQACTALTQHADDLKQCKSFARILDCVEDVTNGIDHFGTLAVYDTSLRVGAHLDRWPKVVYLHAGTRDGYNALLGLCSKSPWVEMDDLPEPLRVLAPHHAENFLCIFKDFFGDGGNGGATKREC